MSLTAPPADITSLDNSHDKVVCVCSQGDFWVDLMGSVGRRNAAEETSQGHQWQMLQ